MKFFTVLACTFIFCINVSAQIPTWAWAKNLAYGTYLPGSNGRANRSEFVDGQGNIYIATTYRDKVYLDTDSLITPTTSMYGIFIVKYNSNGDLVWKKSGITNTNYYIGTTGLSGDNNGKLYLSYYFVDTLNYDGNLVIETTGDVFASLQTMSINSADGSFNWSTEILPKYNGSSQIGVNPSGEIVLAYMNMQTPAQDTFGIVKINSIGAKTLERKHLIGTYSYFNVKAIGTTGNNIFIMGSYTNNFTLAGQAFTTSTADFIVARFDNTGSLTWSGGGKSSGTVLTETGTITEDANGNFYFCGAFSGTLSVLGTSQTLAIGTKGSGNLVELMYAKYSSNGSLVWLKQATGERSHYAKIIRIGADNKLYMMGRMGSKKLFLGGDSTEAAGINSSNPYFISQLDTTGNVLWLKRVNNTGNIQGNMNLFVDNSMNLYFAGSYDNMGFTIEPFSLPTIFSNKVFYAKTADLATPTGVRILPSKELPVSYNLEQNYPNPFNPTTTFSFDVPVTGFVSLKVFDITGKEVATLVNQIVTAGRYETTFDASGLASGVYFSRLSSGDVVQMKKLVLQK